MGFCLVLLFVVTVMMLTTRTGRIVSDGEVGRIRRKDEICMKVDDIYKHVDGGKQENIDYQPRKGSRYKQKDQTKKQKEKRMEITTQVKIQNMSPYTHTKIYENEHHHGETKKYIESGADISFLTDHFFCESFNLSLVTMIIIETDDEVGHIHVRLGNTRALVQEADQPAERGNQRHQNYERDDMAIIVDLNLYRRHRHRQSTRNNLSSLVDSHTSSGFNSLMVYDDSELSSTSYLAISRNDFSVTSGQQNIQRPTISSGYQSARRRSSVPSSSFSFSHQLQVDRPITEEQNNGYVDDNIDNVIEPHTSCSMNNQQFPICSQDLAGQQAQQNSTVRGCRLRESEILPQSSPIPPSTVLRTARYETRENRLSSGENTSTVSLRECTQRKEVQSSRSGENPPDNNYQQVAPATPTTTASSRPNPRDQRRMLEMTTGSAICNNDSSSNGSKEECAVCSCSRSLSHDMYNINRETSKEQGKQAAQYDTTESICKADESKDCCHRNSDHYGSFDRIQRNGNSICQDQTQRSLSTTTFTEEQNERQVSEFVGTILGAASSSLTNDDDLFGKGQSLIPNSDLFELTEENGEEGEDEVNEITDCSTGDTRGEDLPQDD